MPESFRKNGFKIFVMVLLVALIAVFSYTLLKPKDKQFPMNKEAPEFALDNYDGRKVSLKDTEGKAKLVYFFYSTCPDVCSPTTYMLSKVQDALVKKGEFGNKTAFVSISFDPTNDTPEQLKTFAGQFHADPKGWYFLRGDEKKMIELAEKYGVLVMKDEKTGTFSHSNAIILVDGHNKIRSWYNGSDADLNTDSIAQDLIQLSKQ